MTWFCFPVKVAAKSSRLAKSTASPVRPFHHTGGAKGHHFVWKKKVTEFSTEKAKIILACILIPGTAISALPFVPLNWIPNIPDQLLF